MRVVGEATTPRALPYRENMTLLDAMIETGGLTRYAAGNRATLVRTVNGAQASYQVFLDSLIKQGDIGANVALLPGDIIIIPQTLFLIPAGYGGRGTVGERALTQDGRRWVTDC